MAHCPQCGGSLNTAGECTNYSCHLNMSSIIPWPDTPKGCICPPTSEQTCQSPTCPRRDHTRDLETPKPSWK